MDGGRRNAIIFGDAQCQFPMGGNPNLQNSKTPSSESSGSGLLPLRGVLEVGRGLRCGFQPNRREGKRVKDIGEREGWKNRRGLKKSPRGGVETRRGVGEKRKWGKKWGGREVAKEEKDGTTEIEGRRRGVQSTWRKRATGRKAVVGSREGRNGPNDDKKHARRQNGGRGQDGKTGLTRLANPVLPHLRR